MTHTVHVVVPGPIGQISGGYIYDRRVVEGLVALGHRVVVHELAGRFPLIDEAARAAAEAILPALRAADRTVIDGLALPAFERCLERVPRAWVALVHHPLALETGHSAERARRLRELERLMLGHAARVIVTSRRTAEDVQDLGVARERIGVVEPGTERRRCAPADGDPPHLLSVGALIPRKGHDLLLTALGRLKAVPWRLTLVGNATREPGTAGRLRAMVEAAGMLERVEFVGEVGPDRLDRLYGAADLFVLASRHEGYGMALGEALARGLPVVSTRAGAIPDTVPGAAGLLVPPDEPDALEGALARFLRDRELRSRLRCGARAAREELRGWPEAAARFADELRRVDL